MSNTTSTRKAKTAAAWKKNALHDVVLPSGTEVTIKLPDITGLIQAGTIPNDLLDAAISQAGGADENPTSKENVEKEHKFRNILISLTVVEPSLTEEEANDIPSEDKEMLVQFATRQRDLDALGNHIAGLDKSEQFRKFRRLGEFDPVLAGLEGGG